MSKHIVCALLGAHLPEPSDLCAFEAQGFRFLRHPQGGAAEWNRYEAVFVFSDTTQISPDAVNGWIGHPHLRTIVGSTAEIRLASLQTELFALTSDVECERKFLVTFPDLNALEQSPFAACAHIVQTYLLPIDNCTERVRMRESDGEIIYTHTVKRRIDDMSCEEIESTLSKADYDAFLKRADPRKKPVEKTRWCILHEGFYFELDIYPFWTDRAIVEVEVATPTDAPFPFPPYFRVVRAVTGDLRYKNVRLADEVPMDPLD